MSNVHIRFLEYKVFADIQIHPTMHRRGQAGNLTAEERPRSRRRQHPSVCSVRSGGLGRFRYWKASSYRSAVQEQMSTECGSHRPITLLSVPCRLCPHPPGQAGSTAAGTPTTSHRRPHQSGFMQCRSKLDAILALWLQAEIFREFQ